MTIMLLTLCQHFHTVLGMNENDGMKHVIEKEIHINCNKYYDVLVFYLVLCGQQQIILNNFILFSAHLIDDREATLNNNEIKCSC